MQNNQNPFDPAPNPNPEVPPAAPPSNSYGSPTPTGSTPSYGSTPPPPPSSPYGGPPPAAPPPPYGGDSPPYGSQPPYSPPTGNGRAGTVSLDVIGEAWRLLQPNIGIWIAAIFIAIIISGGVSQLSNLMILGASRNNQQPPLLLTIIASIPGWIVGTLVGAGLTKMSIQQLRTGRAEIGEMFGVVSLLGPLLLAALITTLATYVGFIFCIIPGIIIGLGLCMTNPLIVDQQLAPMDAMQRSWNTMKSQLGMLFVLGIVLFLLNIVGLCACIVGLLVTAPISIISMALVYRDMFLNGVTPPNAVDPNYPVPPISSPR